MGLFTGLIQDIGKILKMDRQRGGVALTISTRLDLSAARLGDSVAVDGACLTVVKLSGHSFTVEVAPETLQRTTLATMKEGQTVNLETPLKISDPLGGHMVSGHIDGTGEIIGSEPEGNAQRIRFRVPPPIGRYLIEKGSVAVDGISLTVAECGEEEFSVSVIPHTWQKTTLIGKKAGDRVNIENDLIAKYVEKFLRPREERPPEKSRIDNDFLARHGFSGR